MILADSSIWVDHFRAFLPRLAELLESGELSCHPFVIGELALGSLTRRDLIVSTLKDMPQVELATHDEVLQFVERRKLYSLGLGYVDVHLLASVVLTPGTTLWTRDRRLAQAAAVLGLLADDFDQPQ